MANKIQITTMGRVSPGEFITSPDADYEGFGAQTQAEVNDDYEAERLEWLRVKMAGGHADVGFVTLIDEFGDARKHSVSWELVVWRLVDENGIPVRAGE